MTYKTILVHLDATRHCAERVAVASRLALDFGAHLTGLYTANRQELPSYARAEGGPTLTDEWRRIFRERGQDASARFLEETSRAGLESAEARAAEGDPVGAMTRAARYADLVVVGQHDPEDDRDLPGLPADFAEQVLQSAPRPLLMLPYAGSFPRIGERVLVAWDATRTAARAVTGALPFLKRAAKVTVLCVNPETEGDHGEIPGADIAHYLARHGVKVEAAESYTREVDTGSILVSRAFDLAADLLVMGGYGHSYLREQVLGGTTRSVLGQMTLPVLIEH